MNKPQSNSLIFTVKTTAQINEQIELEPGDRIEVLSEYVYTPQGETVSSTEYAQMYEGQQDVFISFTDIEKIGINPNSKYNTPIGIYTYPLKWVLEQVPENESSNKLGNFVPFAGSKRNIYFVRYNGNRRWLHDDNYGRKDFNKDVEELYDYFIDTVFDSKMDSKTIIMGWERIHKLIPKNTAMEKENLMLYPKLKNKEQSAVRNFFYKVLVETSFDRMGYDQSYLIALMSLTHYIATFRKNVPVRWNTILRRVLNIGLIEDRYGIGFIHISEPVQAVFTSRKSFDIIDHIKNEGRVVSEDMPEWLKNATISDDANFNIEDGEVEWYSGTWYNGTFREGTWWMGTWKEGTMNNPFGVWFDGIWENGVWLNGAFQGGRWEYGTFKGGVWTGGVWIDGIWEDGLIYSEKFDEIIPSEFNPKEFSKKEKEAETLEELGEMLGNI